MDKRKFVRFNVDLPVRYRVLESLGPYKITSTEDMCENGIRINLPEYFEPGTILELTINIPDQSRPIATIGRIVWVKKDLFSDAYTSGLSLVHIKELDKEKFYQYALL